MAICGDVTGIPYTRYPDITTTMLSEFIKAKVKVILQEENLAEEPDVYCCPMRFGSDRGGIKYAAMVIGMAGVVEEGDTLYDKLKPMNYRPQINKTVLNAIVRSYEFSEAKLLKYMESPRLLRGLALSTKDIETLYQYRRLQMTKVHDKPYYTFCADMDRILDEFLMNSEEDDPPVPNYTVLSIKALGDKEDSPLSYDIMVCEQGNPVLESKAELFKALVNRNH